MIARNMTQILSYQDFGGNARNNSFIFMGPIEKTFENVV
jgi:hypothetical protein